MASGRAEERASEQAGELTDIWTIGYSLVCAVAPIGGGAGGPSPPPQDSPKLLFYLFHRFNVQYMYKHVKLYYISVHELLSIGGADIRSFWHDSAKKNFSHAKKNFAPPKKFVNWRPWVCGQSCSLASRQSSSLACQQSSSLACKAIV